MSKVLVRRHERHFPDADYRGIAVTYLGLRGGDPAFRLEVGLNGDVHRIETTAAGSLDIIGPSGLLSLIDRLAELHERGLGLVLEIVDANPQGVRSRRRRRCAQPSRAGGTRSGPALPASWR